MAIYEATGGAIFWPTYIAIEIVIDWAIFGAFIGTGVSLADILDFKKTEKKAILPSR